MFTLWDGCFIVINRNKVNDVDMEMWEVRNFHPGDIRACGAHLATVKLSFNVNRQRMTEMKVGVLRVIQPQLSFQDEEDLVEWIIRSRVSVVTGYFGRNAPQLRNVAIRTGAIYSQPAAQYVYWGEPRIHQRILTHPSFYMCFGHFRDFKMQDPTEIPPQWRFGEDLQQELIDVDDVPRWPENWDGNPMVHNLGLIKTKKIDFRKGRWIYNVMQTCIWLGTSQPAHSSVAKMEFMDSIQQYARQNE